MYLIGDIGNTETKIFLFDQNFKIKKKMELSINKDKQKISLFKYAFFDKTKIKS